MPSGPKKRKAAKKKETEGKTQSSIQEESNSKLESIDEITTVDDVLDSSKGLPTDHHDISVVEDHDHGQDLNSNIQENDAVSDLVSVELAELAGMGFSGVDDIAAVVPENVETDLPVQQNVDGHLQISEQLEGLKKMVIEELCAADKTTTTLRELLDGLAKIQQIIIEQ
ncbi:uncharacterized protein [Henckelia pumila]|uniref:uncharacterized protein n=1 Tax=Henckelia pumila TaxID=405737 RepID=UPI003C6E65B5